MISHMISPMMLLIIIMIILSVPLYEMISQVPLSHTMAGDKPTLTGNNLVMGSKPQMMFTINNSIMELEIKENKFGIIEVRDKEKKEALEMIVIPVHIEWSYFYFLVIIMTFFKFWS